MNEFSKLNGYDVKDKKAIRYYDTVASMKSDSTLKEGMFVKTKGYYQINDGGNATYNITDTSSILEYQEELNNGLYATLIINESVKPEQLGAYGDGIHDDTNILQYVITNFNHIILNKNYKITSTILLDGRKKIDLLGVINYTGTDYCFKIKNKFNVIDGNTKGQLIGNNENKGILITSDNEEENFSYYNTIKNIDIHNFINGITLYNIESYRHISYFNTIENCILTDCIDGILLKGYANGNRINNITFYNNGIANDKTHASIVLTEENGHYPEENMFSELFVTNSFHTVCILINGTSKFNTFINSCFEPGGNAYVTYTPIANIPNIQNNIFDFIDLTNYGNYIEQHDTNNLNTYRSQAYLKTKEFSYRSETNPLEKTLFYSDNTTYAENSYVPLLNLDLANYRSMKVQITPYIFTGNAYANQPNNDLITNVYNKNGYGITNTNDFKVEDGILYFKTQSAEIGGTPLQFKIKLILGSYSVFGAGSVNYSMTSNWTKL